MFKNTEKFEKWLKEILKPAYADYVENEFTYWLNEVDKQYGETGFCEFEVPKYMTISRNPECIRFDVEIKEIQDEDCFETTYIF